ncbi:hypothetical protein AB6N21_002572 [Thiohalocapsa marina]|nr:hypothetical protein [Thiohalocapsa marina]
MHQLAQVVASRIARLLELNTDPVALLEIDPRHPAYLGHDSDRRHGGVRLQTKQEAAADSMGFRRKQAESAKTQVFGQQIPASVRLPDRADADGFSVDDA